MRTSALPHFTLEQIARQLTDDFWTNQGEARRAFKLGADKALTYDVSTLSPDEQYLARSALQAWGVASGIRFVDVGLSVWAPVVSELRDLPASRTTQQDLAVNSTFEGSLTSRSDEDWLRITLQAGKTYTITVDGKGAGALRDPYLALYGSTGNLIRWDDDGGNGNHSAMTFKATRTGTFYLAVESGTPGQQGDYRLTLRQGKAAEITFTNDHYEDGAWSTSEVTGRRITSSLVNVESGWDDAPVSLNTYWFQTYVHEVGHALGLGHGGHYNGDANWPDDAHYAEDSVMMTIMSYFFQSGSASEVNPNFRGDWGYVVTPMAADIAAIRDLYGLTAGSHKGNTTYGHNSNAGGYLEQLFKAMFDGQNSPARVWQDNNILFTLQDSGGYDRLDFSTVNASQVIRLQPGEFSSVGGYRNNMAIAEGTVIEAALGGRGKDWIFGSSRNDHLAGGGGSDVLRGGKGNDTLIGNGGDELYGGDGRDLVDYSALSRDLRVDLKKLTTSFGGDRPKLTNDRLSSIEDIKTGRGDDTQIGDDGANGLLGGAGNDLLRGYDGSDRLLGGMGADTLVGDAGQDTLIGNAGHDNLSGGAGDDRLIGGAGRDSFHFANGRDRIVDFTPGEDLLYLHRKAWGGHSRSPTSSLSEAVFVAGDLILDYGKGHVLVLEGIDSLQGLARSIVVI